MGKKPQNQTQTSVISPWFGKCGEIFSDKLFGKISELEENVSKNVRLTGKVPCVTLIRDFFCESM